MFAQRASQFTVFLLKTGEPRSVLKRKQKLVCGDGFLEEVERAQFGGADGHVNVRLAGHHYHRRGYTKGFDLFKESDPIFDRHHHVRENQIETLILNQLQRAVWLVTYRGLMPGESKGTRKRSQSVRLVVDDEQARFRHACTLPAKALPRNCVAGLR